MKGKRILFILSAVSAALFIAAFSCILTVFGKESGIEIPLYHRHTEKCTGEIMILQEADGDTSLRTVSESVCPVCGGVVHDYLFIAECSCGFHIEREGWACYHSIFGDDPDGCPTYSEIDFNTEHEHKTEGLVCGKEETDVIGHIGIGISDTEPARTVTLKADYSGEIRYSDFAWEDPEGNPLPGSSISVEKNGLYTLISVCSAEGNMYSISKEIQIHNIDSEGPEIKVLKVNRMEPTNRPVKITVKAEDRMAGLSEAAYSIDGVHFQEGNVFEVTDNGTYKITVSDRLGNLSSKEMIIDNIDTEPPKVKLTMTPEIWEEGECVITAEAEDTGLGLSGNPYSFDKGKTWGSKNSITLSEPGTVTVRVRDAAGNKSTMVLEAVLKPKKEEESDGTNEEVSEEKKDGDNVEESVKEEKEKEKKETDNSETEKPETEKQESENEKQLGEVIEEGTFITERDTLPKGDEVTEKAGENKTKAVEQKKKKEKQKKENPGSENPESDNPEKEEENGREELNETVSSPEKESVQDGREERSESPDLRPDGDAGEETQKKRENDIFLKKLRLKFMNLPKEIRVLGITSSALTGAATTGFGIFLLVRSAGVFWVDGDGKEHFLARIPIRRKGEIYSLTVNRSSLMNAETGDLRIRLPGIFTMLHKYRPITIGIGNTTVSQYVEKRISVHLPGFLH